MEPREELGNENDVILTSLETSGLTQTDADKETIQCRRRLQRLNLKRNLPPKSADKKSTLPDVVHVVALTSDDGILDAASISALTIRSEMVYRCDMSSFLAGDLTHMFIEQEAIGLLRQLARSRDDPPTNNQIRPIIWVAYDVGALVVKAALILAATRENDHLGIFNETSHIIFVRCPQRTLTQFALESKLFQLLYGNKDKDWYNLLTATSIRYLANAVQETTSDFINSKITLYCPVLSLCIANVPATPGLDYFTASLGVQTEMIVQQKNMQAPKSSSSRLSNNSSQRMRPRARTQLQKTLVALSASPRQSQPASFFPPPSWLLQNQKYNEWDGSMGPQILYLYGSRHDSTVAACDIADQISAQWLIKQPENRRYARNFAFTFDSADPSRDSISGMIAELCLDVFTATTEGTIHEACSILEDQFRFRGGWSERSCLSIFNSLRNCTLNRLRLLLVLHHFDECNPHSRELFLGFCSELRDRNELPLKIVITSKKPSILRKQMREWISIDADGLDKNETSEVFSSEPKSKVATGHDDIVQQTLKSLVRLCPVEDDQNQAIEKIKALAAANEDDAHVILALLRDHTCWPADPSSEHWWLFSKLLSDINPTSTPKHVLHAILASNEDGDGLRWVLGWLLCSYRPLTRWELAAVLCHHRHPEQQQSRKPTSSSRLERQVAMQLAWRQLESWLRVLGDFSSSGQVILRSDIRSLLDDGDDTDDYFWSGPRKTSHQRIAQFCLDQLALTETSALLRLMWNGYESRRDPKHLSVTPPITSDGKDLIFYAVQALPHHLCECPIEYAAEVLRSLIKDPDSQSLVPWAKIQWAMSNPFARTPEPPRSALSALIGHGVILPEDFTQLDESAQAECFIAGCGNNRRDTVNLYLKKTSIPNAVLEEALVSAIQASDEDLAKEIVGKMQPPVSSDNTLGWCLPATIVWAATWLDMDGLLDLLLRKGASPDPQEAGKTAPETAYFPCPLYMASYLCHARTADVLLRHGARLDILRADYWSCFDQAVAAGNPDMLRAYLEKDASLVKRGWNQNPFFTTAMHGSWKSVRVLVDFKGDPNTPGSGGNDRDSWAPLAVASCWGMHKTTEAFLMENADPGIMNRNGRDGLSTPLLIAVLQGDITCTRVLLKYGSDPNREGFESPLIHQLIGKKMDTRTVIGICDALIENDPPVQVSSPDRRDGETALMRASAEGQLPLVIWLLENGADINAVDSKNRDALQYAVRGAVGRVNNAHDHVAVVQKLLDYHPSLDAPDNTESGETALHAALMEPKMVELLLKAGANPEIKTSSGRTLINMAVARCQAEVVRMLINHKANLNHHDGHGLAPIALAVCFVRNAAIVRLLAEGGADLRDVVRGRTLIERSLTGPPDVLKTLLEFRKFIDIERQNSEGRTALMTIGDSVNLDSLRVLIQAGADVNAKDPDGLTPLIHACSLARLDVQSLLLAQPDIDTHYMSRKHGSALHAACRCGRKNAVISLLSRETSVDAVNAVNPSVLFTTPLIAATVPPHNSGDIDQIVRILVEHGADVRLTTRRTFHSAISSACLGSGVETINFLLDERAPAQLADPNTGRLPLHFAAANGLQNFQAIVLQYQGDMMTADRGGKNCLHWAAQFGNVRTVEFIISRLTKSNRLVDRYINQADSDGWTPLCWAVRHLKQETDWFWGRKSEDMSFVDTVRTLLRNGADRTVKCRWGSNDSDELRSLDLARRCEAGGEIIDLLARGIEDGPDFDRPVDQTPSSSPAPARAYNKWDITCDVCLMPIFGLVFKCTDCADFDLCTKCHASRDIFHSAEVLDDKKKHSLKERSDKEEYHDLEPASPRPPEVDGDDLDGNETTEDNDRNRGRKSGVMEMDAEMDAEMDVMDMDVMDMDAMEMEEAEES